MLRHPPLVALALLAGASVAFAEVTETERQALGERIDAFVDHLEAGENAEMLEMMPPGLWAEMAERAGAPVDAVKDAVIGQMVVAMEDVSIEDMTHDMADADFGTTGAERDWATVPVTMTVVVGEESMRVDSAIVGLVDEETWYLVRIDNRQQADLLHAAYPDLQDANLLP